MKSEAKIWDSHIHLFTPEMEQRPSFWADRNRETIWKACVAPPQRPSIQGWASVNNLLHDMDNAGIETAILLGWYWENAETCRLHNRFYADLIKSHPSRLKAFAAVQAKSGNQALREIDWAIQNGFCGLGEIHPQAQGFSLEDPDWLRVMQQLEGIHFPINFHVSDPDTGGHSGKIETPLQDYLTLADKFPEQVFILAHLGAKIPLRKNLVARSKHPENIYYDCAATPLLYKSDSILEMVKAAGPERILFGSDYPLRVFPKEQKKPDFIKSVEYARGSGLTESELTCVLSTNAKRLFSA